MRMQTDKKCPRFSIVLPAKDEEKNISLLYQEWKKVLERYTNEFELLFIDDGSEDNTFVEIEKLREQDQRVVGLQLRKNYGQTAALQAGFDHAKGEIVVTMDSDLQDVPAEFPKLLKEFEKGFDCVCAWRGGRKDTITKKLLSRIAYQVRRKFLKDKIHDSGCQFRIYKKECVKELNLHGELHRFIPALLTLRGFRLSEVKVEHRQRRFGKTKYNAKRVFKGFVDAFLVRFWQEFAGRPIHFFGGLASFFFLAGCVGTGILAYDKFVKGASIGTRPLLLATALLIIVAMQFLLLGLLADILIEMYYTRDGNRPYAIRKKTDRP